MLTFSRYVFRQAAGVLLLILLSLGGIVWIALALRELNVVTSQGQNALVLLQMTTLALPNLLGVIAPFALLIAVVHVLSRLSGDSELIVLTASGATVWTIARPLLLLAFVVSLAVSFVNHIGMPWSLRTLREFVVQVRTDLLTQVIQPGRFSSPESGLTFTSATAPRMARSWASSCTTCARRPSRSRISRRAGSSSNRTKPPT
jgi:lipopolysaccharide export system permease protein